jgi:HAD superfamily phosphatase
MGENVTVRVHSDGVRILLQDFADSAKIRIRPRSSSFLWDHEPEGLRKTVPRSLRKTVQRTAFPMERKLRPEILIFDVDGVLVDVRDTYWRSALETVRHLTGKRVTHEELHGWKGKPGNNDDWQMVANWATELGRVTSYAEAREAFGKFYWGTDEQPGNVRREKIIVSPAQIARWAGRYELNLFTGRNRQELEYTFSKWPGTVYFKKIVTMDDVAKIKPHPEGLYKILGKREPATALYLGDNIDDALAARDAGVPFAAIIAVGEPNYRNRAAAFRRLGAIALLPRTIDVNKLLRKRALAP